MPKWENKEITIDNKRDSKPEKANSRKILVEKFSNIVRVADRLHSLGYTEESVNHFLNRYTDHVNKSSKHPFTYVGIGNGSGFVDSEYIGKDFQFPNYIYDRSSVQSKQNPGIYGWKYVDDILVGINKNGDIFLDEQHKPVIWEADVAENISELPNINLSENYGKIYSFNSRIFIICNQSILEVLSLQLEGKKRMSAKDFLMGREIEQGYKAGI